MRNIDESWYTDDRRKEKCWGVPLIPTDQDSKAKAAKEKLKKKNKLKKQKKKVEKKEAKKALESNLLSVYSDESSDEEPESPRGVARKVRVKDTDATHSIKRVKYKDSDVLASVKSLKAAKDSNDQTNTLYGTMSDDIRFKGDRKKEWTSSQAGLKRWTLLSSVEIR